MENMRQKKCPNCGALIPSLSLKCPECGFVFSTESESSAIARESIERLQHMLKEIDQSGMAFMKKANAKKKATIINTFVVPNTKEAMISFLALAFSNIESTNKTQDRAITMAWEGKAISTYNLLKLQKGSDPQIESALKQYCVLEDKKALAKLDGSAKIKARRRWIVIGLVLVAAILCIPTISNLVYSFKYDPVLEAIDAGEYDEAINHIISDSELKQDVDFYIDKLANSPVALAKTLVEIDPTTDTRVKTIIRNDGSKTVFKSKTDLSKNVEYSAFNPDGTIRYSIIDSLRLSEKLWSINSSPSEIDILELYEADTLGVHLDNRGRCDVLVYAFSGDTTKCYFQYNNQDLVVQQDIYSSEDTTHIVTTVSHDNGIYLFIDNTVGGSFTRMTTRSFDDNHSSLNYSMNWEILGQSFLIHRDSFEKYSRVSIFTSENVPDESLLSFDFDDDLMIDTREVRSIQTGKGVVLDYQQFINDDE